MDMVMAMEQDRWQRIDYAIAYLRGVKKTNGRITENDIASSFDFVGLDEDEYDFDDIDYIISMVN